MRLAALIVGFCGLLVVSLPATAGGEAAGAGGKIYLAKCAICHGKDGSGDTPQGKKLKARDLRSAEVQKQTDEQLFAVTAKGVEKKMPGYEKTLGAEKIHELVAFMRQIAKP